jgi:hypothetical protein
VVLVLVVEEVIEEGGMITEIVVDLIVALIEEVTITHNPLTATAEVDLDLVCNSKLGPLQFLKKQRMKKILEGKRAKNPSLNSKMKNLPQKTPKPKHRRRKVLMLNNLYKRRQVIMERRKKNSSKENQKLSTRELPHSSRHPLADVVM